MALPVFSTDCGIPGMISMPSSPTSSSLSRRSSDRERRLLLPARPLNLRKEISLTRQESLLEHLQSAFPVPLLPLQQQQQQQDQGEKVPPLEFPSLQLSPRFEENEGNSTSIKENAAFASALERLRQKGRRLNRPLPTKEDSSSSDTRTQKQREALERLNAIDNAAATVKRKQARRQQHRRRRHRLDDEAESSNSHLNATFQTKHDGQRTNLVDANQQILPLLDKLKISNSSYGGGDQEVAEDTKKLAAAAANMLLSKSTSSFPNQRPNFSSSNRLMMMMHKNDAMKHSNRKSSSPNLLGGGGTFGSRSRLPSAGRLAMTRVRSSSRVLI